MRVPKRKKEVNPNFEFDPHITSEKYQQLQKKLKQLHNNHKKVKEEMAQHATDGDFCENEPYKASKKRLKSINKQIEKIEHSLKNAVIIDKPENEKIGVGSKVSLKSLDTGKTRKYKILGSQEADPDKGIISQSSPLGSRLLGKQVKDTIELQTPNNVKKYEIVEIE